MEEIKNENEVKMRKIIIRRGLILAIIASVFFMAAIPSHGLTWTTHTDTENFDDDTVGADPTGSWYTYSELDMANESAAVSSDLASKSLEITTTTNTSTGKVLFNVTTLTNYTYVNFSFEQTSWDITNVFACYDANGNTGNQIWRIQTSTGGDIKAYWNSAYVDIGNVTNNTMHDISVYINWTDKTYGVSIDGGAYSWGPQVTSSNSGKIGSFLDLCASSASTTQSTYIDNIAMTAYVPVPNVDPVANFTTSVSDKTVTFTDTSTDSDGNIVNWTWNFGDGNLSYIQNPSHTYDSYGTKTVTLTVTDNDGGTDSISKSITLTQDSTAAIANTFDGVTDMLMELLPVIIVISVFGAIIGMVKRQKWG